MSDTNPDPTAASSDEGAVARLKAAADQTWERLAAVIESSLDRVFDAPLDIRSPQEALYAIDPNDPGTAGTAGLRRAAEWGASRAMRRIGMKFGSKVAGKAVAPIGMAVEFGLSARDGIKELQVLASFLASRFRQEGHVVDRELLRRTVLAVYLAPRLRPDLRIPLHRRSLAVAKRWSMDSLAFTGRRQSNRTQQRVEAIATVPLAVLIEDWRRASAMEARSGPRHVGEAHIAPHPRVIEARIADRPPPPPGHRPPPPPPPARPQ
ncbi:MAG: hypothetical protein ACKV2O_18380 [Acidimicrobiales bacterium]